MAISLSVNLNQVWIFTIMSEKLHFLSSNIVCGIILMRKNSEMSYSIIIYMFSMSFALFLVILPTTIPKVKDTTSTVLKIAKTDFGKKSKKLS